jgi:hypothetical protein
MEKQPSLKFGQLRFSSLLTKSGEIDELQFDELTVSPE